MPHPESHSQCLSQDSKPALSESKSRILSTMSFKLLTHSPLGDQLYGASLDLVHHIHYKRQFEPVVTTWILEDLCLILSCDTHWLSDTG